MIVKIKRRFRFYPTDAQQASLARTFGCVRFVYNAALAYRKDEYAAGNKPNYHSSSSFLTELKKVHTFLAEVSCVPTQQSLRQLQTAYSNFFRKTASFPSFKRKNSRESCEYTRSGFSFKNGKLTLAKMDGHLRIKWSMPLASDPTTVTITREASGKYFVTFTVEEEKKPLAKLNTSVGIDLGIETFATFSTGEKVKLPASIKAMRSKIASANKSLSRKKSGSIGFRRAKLKLAKLHEKLANIRKDFLDKLSSRVVRENQVVSLEDLKVQEMIKDSGLARSIGEQGWRMFRNMLTYKCLWAGRELRVCDKYLPTSKVCSACGAKTKLKLSDRKWVCKCGATHDRDINAAINILAGGQPVSACGDLKKTSKPYVLRRRSVKHEPPVESGISVL